MPRQSKITPPITPQNAHEIAEERAKASSPPPSPPPEPAAAAVAEAPTSRKKRAPGPSETPPEAWTLLLVEHWQQLAWASLEFRAGARGSFLPIPDTDYAIVDDPRPPVSHAAEIAQSLWRRALVHCEEEGGPIDYRLVAHDKTGGALGRTTKASRIDVTSPDGRPRELADDNASAIMRSAIALVEAGTRTVSARDRGTESVVDACGKALAAAAGALAQVTSAVAALEGAAASRVQAEGEVWLAKAEFTKQAHDDELDREGAAEAAQDRRDKFFAWLDAHGSPIADAIGEAISKFSDAFVNSKPAEPPPDSEPQQPTRKRGKTLSGQPMDEFIHNED